MTNEHMRTARRSERGMALIMVLLLMAVVSSLVAGLTMNGQVEVAMAANEATYAGARAAAEAGMNRASAAIVADTTTDLLAEASAAGGRADFLFPAAPPHTIGVNGEYWYEVDIFDDDDPELYGGVALTPAQLASMGEDDDPLNDTNDRLVLRVTGFGPRNTTVRIGRILERWDNSLPMSSPTPTLLDPALLVNGSLLVTGNIEVGGSMGNVHANGNMTIEGNAWTVLGDATASGSFTAVAERAGGVQGGGRPTVNVPDVNASDYIDLATHILRADGTMTNLTGTGCVVLNCGWSFTAGAGGSPGTWNITGNGANAADPGTFFVEGNVNISGNPSLTGGGGGTRQPLPLSVIALGTIQVTGTPVLRPHNELALQFVTNGDLVISGNADFDNTVVEGQSLVREQLLISGNPSLLGQIIVQDVTDCSPGTCSTTVTENAVLGNMSIVYNGSFDGLAENPTLTSASPTYGSNIRGWIEGM